MSSLSCVNSLSEHFNEENPNFMVALGLFLTKHTHSTRYWSAIYRTRHYWCCLLWQKIFYHKITTKEKKTRCTHPKPNEAKRLLEEILKENGSSNEYHCKKAKRNAQKSFLFLEQMEKDLEKAIYALIQKPLRAAIREDLREHSVCPYLPLMLVSRLVQNKVAIF